MNKKDLKEALKTSAGGSSMMTTAQVMEFLGRGKTFTQGFLKGVDYYGGDRRGKMYFIGDIADKILENTRMG